MEPDTLKRFDRLVSILIQLQSKRIVRSKELADRFGVSLRTIYRDLQTLEKAGVPVYGEAGVGYSLVEGYRLPPVMFTREEAGSFLAAEKLMQQFTDKGLGEYFESAMYKIKSVLRGSEKEWLAALDAQVTVNNSRPVFNESVPNALPILFESLAEKKQIILNYQALNAASPESRAIEPIGLFHENHFWYILGYCHLRHDYRQFRLDRIQDIHKTDQHFSRQHGTVDEHRYNKCSPEKRTEVKLLIDHPVSHYMTSGFQYYQVISKENRGSQVAITLSVKASDQGFVRWLLMFEDYLEIIEPAALRQEVKSILARSLKRLERYERTRNIPL
ncbi:MAG TPA: YafY family protein [Edaphocola sp.]|nr:YafY family protein [Edaphocola sp.]